MHHFASFVIHASAKYIRISLAKSWNVHPKIMDSHIKRLSVDFMIFPVSQRYLGNLASGFRVLSTYSLVSKLWPRDSAALSHRTTRQLYRRPWILASRQRPQQTPWHVFLYGIGAPARWWKCRPASSLQLWSDYRCWYPSCVH